MLEDLKAAGCETLALDVTAEESMSAAVAAVEEAEGAVGALVNNAGYSQSGALETLALDDVRRQFETNVFGLLRMCQLVLPGMRRQGYGRIVNVSSMGGKLTFPGGGVYHATKHAVEALSDALRFEVQGFGVDVAIIEPGLIKTNFAETAVGSVSYDDGPYAEFNTAVSANTAGAYDGAFGQAGRRSREGGEGDRAGDHRAAAAHALPGHRVGAAVPRPARAAARPRLGSRGGNLLPAARSRLGFRAVAYFKDADEVYAYIGKLFEDLAEDDELAPKFRKANTIVQYQYREPESQITVKLIDGEDGQVDCGATDHGARGGHDHGRRHRPSLLARQGQRDRGAGPRADEGQGPRGQDPQAGAAREAGLPALPADARGGRPRGPARGLVSDALEPLRGFKDFYQYISPTRVIAGRDLLESTGFEFMKEGAEPGARS